MSTQKIALDSRQLRILRFAPDSRKLPTLGTRIMEIRILAAHGLLTVPRIHHWGHSYQLTQDGFAALLAHAPEGCRGAA